MASVLHGCARTTPCLRAKFQSDNERSGVLSTAMSFLGLYRDPVVAAVTRQCDWPIRDLVEGATPATLYLVEPPSDISRTKPLSG